MPRREVRVWVHVVDPGGNSAPLELPASVGRDGHEVPVVLQRGRAELRGGAGELSLVLGASPSRDGRHDGGGV
jgi:hypothetical protein